MLGRKEEEDEEEDDIWECIFRHRCKELRDLWMERQNPKKELLITPCS